MSICSELNIMTQPLSHKYFGLPAMVGIDRSDSFIHLLERAINRPKVWRKKLSMGGKEILLKAVIQSLHVFAMAVFNIPKNVN